MYSTIAVCADGAKEERIYGKLKEIFEVKGGENMKRIVQICLIMTGIFWGAFHVYGSSTYQILKDQQIEFTDILVEGDSLVLVRNEKNGFSSEGIYLGVYNCVERMWAVEYQAYGEYLESSYYAGDGIFALSDVFLKTIMPICSMPTK